nr:MAG TPA: hypothetical protein [Caudoviricetes sp.]
MTERGLDGCKRRVHPGWHYIQAAGGQVQGAAADSRQAGKGGRLGWSAPTGDRQIGHAGS